jgi:hypothetical protein
MRRTIYDRTKADVEISAPGKISAPVKFSAPARFSPFSVKNQKFYLGF